MKKLICPTDFSENSLKAIEYAIHLANKTGAKITLLHCYHSFFLPPSNVSTAIAGLEEEAGLKMGEFLDQVMKLEGAEDVFFETELRPGLAVDEINKTAEKLDADIIIMGTKGANGLEEAILGSNTSSLISRTKTPVLVIPEDAAFKGINTIVFATDFMDDNEVVVQQLVDLATLFDAQIHAVHVLEPNEVYSPDQREQLSRLYPELFNYKKLEFHLINAQDVISGINTFIEKANGDLLAMLTHRRNFFERIFHKSITKKMACHTEVPLLAFHE